MKKTVLSALLALTLTASLSLPAAAAFSLPDTANTWAEVHITDLFTRKIVEGYPDGLYHPTDDVTRGSVAKMLFLSLRSAGSSISEGIKHNPFHDTKNHWSEKFLSPLIKSGIVLDSEYTKGFQPDQPMSRLETIKAIVRAYLHSHPDEVLPAKITLKFTDAAEIAKADLPYVQMGVALKIINGYDDGSFRPSGNIQRSTAAAMMSRFIKVVGTISDELTMGADNRVDGKVDTNMPAPEIENVEWVLKPTVKLLYNDSNFGEFSEEGLGCYWDHSDLQNPTFIDLKGNTYQMKGVSYRAPFVQGIAPVVDLKTHKFGYVNFSGKWVHEADLDSAYVISKYYLTDGTVKYYALADKAGVSGYVGLDGKFVDDWVGTVDIEKTCGPEFRTPSGRDVFGNSKGGLFLYIEDASHGATVDDYVGICDQNGKAIVAPSYSRVPTDNLHSTYLSGTAYDDCFVLTHKLTLTWDTVKDIYDGTTGKLLYTFYNSDYCGSPKIDIIGYGQGLFTSGNGAEPRERLYGFMAPDGTVVVPRVFESVRPFSNGYAWVKTGGLWGIIKLPKF